jgi:hypothetical protein
MKKGDERSKRRCGNFREIVKRKGINVSRQLLER